MTASLHLWAGNADPLLATLPLAGLSVHTLVFRAPDGRTGFDHSAEASAALRSCADRLLLVRGDTGAGEAIETRDNIMEVVRTAIAPRAFVLLEALPALDDALDAFADYRKAFAKKALTERLGRAFVSPPEPTLAGLFHETVTERAIQSAAGLAAGLFVFRFAGEWNIAATLLSRHNAIESVARRVALTGVDIVKAADERSLPMW